jgi:hypothetical protein
MIPTMPKTSIIVQTTLTVFTIVTMYTQVKNLYGFIKSKDVKAKLEVGGFETFCFKEVGEEVINGQVFKFLFAFIQTRQDIVSNKLSSNTSRFNKS